MTEKVKIFDSIEEAEKEVPLNKSAKVKINEKTICLSHTNKGFFAISDTCPHLGASLSGGHLNNWNEVVCPWHSYKFNLKTGDETSGYGYKVKKYPIEITNEGFFITI